MLIEENKILSVLLTYDFLSIFILYFREVLYFGPVKCFIFKREKYCKVISIM